MYLSKYDYTIQYKLGKGNFVADALSCMPMHEEGQYYILSMPNFVFLKDLQKSLQENPQFQQLVTQVQQDPTLFTDYKMHDGLLLYKGKIWIDSSNPFRPLLLEEFHKTPLGGTWE